MRNRREVFAQEEAPEKEVFLRCLPPLLGSAQFFAAGKSLFQEDLVNALKDVMK